MLAKQQAYSAVLGSSRFRQIWRETNRTQPRATRIVRAHLEGAGDGDQGASEADQRCDRPGYFTAKKDVTLDFATFVLMGVVVLLFSARKTYRRRTRTT